MKFFKNLFAKKEAAEALIYIEGLGKLEWDKESEYWSGNKNGYNFSVAYDGFYKPTDELVKSAVRAFADPGYIDGIIAKIKQLAKEKYPLGKHVD